MTLFNIAYLASAAVGAAALLINATSLRRQWGNPRFAALCAALVLITVIFWFAAPITIAMVNRVTGVANISALIVYALVVAFAAATLTFALYWAYPGNEVWPRVRWILAAYALVIAAMVILFAASDVSTERRTDFDTYYADQPSITVFLLLYLFSTLAGAVYLAVQLWHWASPERTHNVAERPASRRALLLFAAATACPILFDTVKIAALAANMFDGHILDDLSTAAPLLNVLAVFLVLAGVAASPRPQPAQNPSPA